MAMSGRSGDFFKMPVGAAALAALAGLDASALAALAGAAVCAGAVPFLSLELPGCGVSGGVAKLTRRVSGFLLECGSA